MPGDDKGLNFVAYAMDAVTWLHWTSVRGTATPSSAVTNLTVAQLTSIYEDQGCTAGGTTFTTPNWACFGGSTAPISIYMAQNGSGTEATWVVAARSDRYVPVRWRGPEPRHLRERDGVDPGQQRPGQRHLLLLVRQVPDDLRPEPGLLLRCVEQQDRAGSDARSRPAKTTIAGPAAWFDRRRRSPVTACCSTCTPDGSNSSIPISSPASLNAVSEDGFLCKPSTATDVDPNTGATYRSEINSIITAQGFFPLPLMVEDGQGATTGVYGTTGTGIPTPAWSSTGGLQSSAYNAAHEAGSPWNFPTGDQDTDNSAIIGHLHRRLLQRQHQRHEDGLGRGPHRVLPDRELGRQLDQLVVHAVRHSRAGSPGCGVRPRSPEPAFWSRRDVKYKGSPVVRPGFLRVRACRF